MKLMFFSSERAEVERLRKELAGAGIGCEVRESGVAEGIFANPAEVGLWLQNEQDYYWASMLCVRLGLGFAKREAVLQAKEQDLAA